MFRINGDFPGELQVSVHLHRGLPPKHLVSLDPGIFLELAMLMPSMPTEVRQKVRREAILARGAAPIASRSMSAMRRWLLCRSSAAAEPDNADDIVLD